MRGFVPQGKITVSTVYQYCQVYQGMKCQTLNKMDFFLNARRFLENASFVNLGVEKCQLATLMYMF